MPYVMPAQDKPRLPRFAVEELREAVEHLQKYNRPDDEGCGVPKEARKASRLYLTTWVQGSLEALLAYAEGGVVPLGSYSEFVYSGGPSLRVKTDYLTSEAFDALTAQKGA